MKRLTFLLILLFLAFSSYGQLQEDLELFKAGRIKCYSTAGNPLANGLILTVDHPETWEIIENDNFTAIIQGKTNDNKTKSIVIAVVNKKGIFIDMSDEEIAETILTEEDLSEAPKDGIKILQTKTINLKNRPWQITNAIHYEKKDKGTIANVMFVNRFIYAGNLVEISLVYAMTEEDFNNWSDEEMDYLIDLFLFIRDSIDIQGSSENIY